MAINGLLASLAILAGLAGFIMLGGYFTLQPNEARLLLLFGAIQGNGAPERISLGQSVLFPTVQAKISLRARTLTVEKLKVNDKRGNPIEIAAVVVWRVEDTAQAAFDVDDYAAYVHTQSETALRHLASPPTATMMAEENEITLRSNVDAVSAGLARGIAAAAGQGGGGGG